MCLLDYATGHTASAASTDSPVLRAEAAERTASLLVVATVRPRAINIPAFLGITRFHKSILEGALVAITSLWSLLVILKALLTSTLLVSVRERIVLKTSIVSLKLSSFSDFINIKLC